MVENIGDAIYNTAVLIVILTYRCTGVDAMVGCLPSHSPCQLSADTYMMKKTVVNISLLYIYLLCDEVFSPTRD